MNRLACLAAALALLSIQAHAAPAANELPSIPAPNGVVRATPSAIIIPEDPATPGGAGCVVGSTGCALAVTATSSGTGDVNIKQVGGNAVTTAVPVSALQLPSTLGAKTSANSLSVVPASDATFTVGTHAVTQGAGSVSNAWTVGGNAASGATNTNNPVLFGGLGTGGIVVGVALDASGNTKVIGPASTGASSTSAPVQVGGLDGGGLVRKFLTNTAGNIQTVPVPSSLSTDAITPTATTAVASNLVAKASAGNLYAWRVTAGASAGYVMLFNATSAPADGAVTPLDCIAVAANATVSSNLNMPERYSTGATIVFSTTGCFTKTASATAFIRASAQ